MKALLNKDLSPSLQFQYVHTVQVSKEINFSCQLLHYRGT